MARIIHIPLSGGDRKAQSKAIREALTLARIWREKAAAARAVGHAKVAEADRLYCDAWTNETFWGQAPKDCPTIAQAINGSRPILWARCRRCNAEPKVDLRELKRDPETPVMAFERALYCKACSGSGHYRVRADILGLMPTPEDAEAPAVEKRLDRD